MYTYTYTYTKNFLSPITTLPNSHTKSRWVVQPTLISPSYFQEVLKIIPTNYSCI